MYINEGRYRDAIREFSCLVDAQPLRWRDTAGVLRRNFCWAVIPTLSATTPE